MVLSERNEETGKLPLPINFAHVKFQDVLESNIIIQGIAIVESTAKKNSCNSFGDSKRHIPANTTKVTNVVKAATTGL